MTLRKKVTTEEIISKGGHVKADLETKQKMKVFCLKMKTELFEKIDKAAESQVGSKNITYWILEAIQEKLKRESK